MRTTAYETNHGMMVNLYQVREMFKEEKSMKGLMRIRAILYESFMTECSSPYSELRNLTFEEYVNVKRSWLAAILGVQKYL